MCLQVLVCGGFQVVAVESERGDHLVEVAADPCAADRASKYQRVVVVLRRLL